jgi:hypothetical protein
MNGYSRRHFTNTALLRELASHLSQDRSTTAMLLADLAEVDARKLYVPAAYPSMFRYCVHELHMSEDEAYKRIQAARAARQFPAIYPAVADGRLHLTAVVLLAPHLTVDTAEGLLAAAAHKSKAAIERLLAERFPQPDLPTVVRAITQTVVADRLALVPAEGAAPQLVPEPVVPSAASNAVVQTGAPPQPLPPRARIAPLAPGRFALQVTITGNAHDLLRQAQALLGHAVPSGDVAEVIERALMLLVEKLEQQKFAKCARTRRSHGTAHPRYIPAEVKRAVFNRDRGQCTFVGENGKRCESRTRLEYDHIEAVARGGRATVAGIRLLCRTHNQHAAECVFGQAFMDGRREQGRSRGRRHEAMPGAPG